MWLAPVIGTVCSFLVFVAVAAIASGILLSMENPSEHIDLSSFAVLIVSAIISGALESRLLGKRGFVNSLIAHAATAAIFILIGAFSGGVTLSCLMNAVCYLGIGAGSAFLGKPKQKNHRKSF